MKMTYFPGFLFLFIIFQDNVNASHLVGGEITYTCLGPAGSNATQYRIRLDIYQDCITGSETARATDNPAYIKIFRSSGASYLFDSIVLTQVITVPPNFSNQCVNDPPNVCLYRATFIKDYTLPNDDSFMIVYQRCCRNQTIINIDRPGEVGVTYFCMIPRVSPLPCNNSAVFKNYPPQIICINNPLVYDHSATDPDGDSLSYEFCEAYVGASPNDPKPVPTGAPFFSVNYLQGYTAEKPMAGFPLIQVNAQTGLITGTPNMSGRFVVAVCCHEWRNGIRINSIKREFQFVVTDCSKAVVANIPQFSDEPNTYIINCENNTVHFENRSTGGFAYSWDFGVPGLQNDTSDSFDPIYVYPDTGTYVVKLVVNRGSTCPDSITRLVKIYPSFNADWEFNGLQCPKEGIQFLDLSISTYKPISYWQWDFGDGSSSSEQNPVHAYEKGGNYNVKLISKSIKGCIDSLAKTVVIEDFKPFAGNDTIIVKGEHIYYNATGGVVYNWLPATNLTSAYVNNPVGYYPDSGRFTYVVYIRSSFGCEGYDTLKVWVMNQGALFVPTAFSPNGDGLNDLLKPISIGYRKINFFRVYNRWGEQMFYTTKVNDGWDGMWKGVPQDAGTYFWILSITNRFGTDELVKGDAALLR